MVLQRNDVNMRNEWNNYTTADSIPMNVQYASATIADDKTWACVLDTSMNLTTGMAYNPTALTPVIRPASITRMVFTDDGDCL
jgi:hypothetical protein